MKKIIKTGQKTKFLSKIICFNWINIKTKNPEFLDWKWIDLEDLPEIAVNFKLNVYKSLKREVSKILN